MWRILIVSLWLLAPLSSGLVPILEDSTPAEVACEPPCGYILPITDIEVNLTSPCPVGDLYYRPGCHSLPARGESLVLEGVVTWGWEITDEAIYHNNPQEPIVFTLSGSSSNPDFLQANFTHASGSLNSAELLTPFYWEVRDEKVFYNYSFPFTVTFTVVGEASPGELERAVNRGHFAYFMKVNSSSSGSTYKESFGIELFTFSLPSEVQTEPPTQPIPAVPFLGVLFICFSILLLRRR